MCLSVLFALCSIPIFQAVVRFIELLRTGTWVPLCASTWGLGRRAGRTFDKKQRLCLPFCIYCSGRYLSHMPANPPQGHASLHYCLRQSQAWVGWALNVFQAVVAVMVLKRWFDLSNCSALVPGYHCAKPLRV